MADGGNTRMTDELQSSADESKYGPAPTAAAAADDNNKENNNQNMTDQTPPPTRANGYSSRMKTSPLPLPLPASDYR